MSDLRSNWLIWLSLALVGSLLQSFVWPFAGIYAALLILIVCALAGGAFLVFKNYWPRDRYDLGALQEFESEARRREAYEQVPEVGEGRVFCMYCGEEYDPKYSSCPICKRCS